MLIKKKSHINKIKACGYHSVEFVLVTPFPGWHGILLLRSVFCLHLLGKEIKKYVKYNTWIKTLKENLTSHWTWYLYNLQHAKLH